MELYNNTTAERIVKAYKHLQHLPLNFRPYDYIIKYKDNPELVADALKTAAEKLSIDVDLTGLARSEYRNNLHEIYEKGYDGSADWLEFHEMIHAVEMLAEGTVKDTVTIDYRQNSGQLTKQFDRQQLADGVTKVSKGTCYCHWAELGKDPFTYWADQEPDNINRFCELAKPWLWFKPVITVALEDIDFKPSVERIDRFNQWFNNYQQSWIQHWKLDNWTIEEIFTVIPIGKLMNLEQFKLQIQQGSYPIGVGI